MMQNNPTTKKVVVGMSGGVDSSAAAIILKKNGWEVTGVFMENWDSFLNGEVNFKDQCTSTKDWEDVRRIGKKLQIPVEKVEFIEEYKNRVFDQFLKDLSKGITPNPDVFCNKYIKFGVFIDYIEKKFPNYKIATGHYAKIQYDNNTPLLVIPKDKGKDQTYFLSNIFNSRLQNVMFPLEDILKKDVRQIVLQADKSLSQKKDSTGICFIGERNFEEFLQNYIPKHAGNIVDIDSNKVMGQHNGIEFYTIGQRKFLKLSGNEERYFVCKKNVSQNTLFVTKGSNGGNMIATSCIVKNFNYISGSSEKKILNKTLSCKFRYNQNFKKIKITKVDNKLNLEVLDKTKFITPGQFAVIYDKDICLGGGVIESVKLMSGTTI